VTGPPRIRLYSKPGCHLCDEARATIENICAELDESYEEVDISSDEVLMHQFGEQIPVTFIDGNQHDFWRVDPVRLKGAGWIPTCRTGSGYARSQPWSRGRCSGWLTRTNCPAHPVTVSCATATSH
jgi:glutaredoxin